MPSPGTGGPERAEECLGENQTLTQWWVGLLWSVEWLFPLIYSILWNSQVDSSRYSCGQVGGGGAKHVMIIKGNAWIWMMYLELAS